MSRPADWQQRKLGRDFHHSYIVQAPAGSGKTELLTQRMLGLLARVDNPEEVVAITFTRKAAAEMSHRLINRLRAAQEQTNGPIENEDLEPHEQISRQLALAVLERDAERGWNLLEQPGRLRIRTIDSLCSELARQLPVLSGLGGGQQISVDATALYRKAATRTMAAIEDSSDDLRQDVVRILDRYDNQYDRLVELLTAMLASREQWINHLLEVRKGKGFDRQGMEDALQYLVEIQLDKARELSPDHLLAALPRFYRYAISNAAANSTALEALLEACGGPDCEYLNLPTNARALPHWQTMINGLLTGSDDVRKAAPNKNDGFPAPSSARCDADKTSFAAWKTDFVELLDSIRHDDALREAFATIRTLPSPAYDDEAWESLESLMRILIRAVQEWNLVMAESGEVDFGEMAQRAIQSLGFEFAPSELALRLDYRIQHLLVDEFQDTSISQVKLIERLTAGWSDGDGRTLFLVGDPMQSIYRFRKAEVSLFIQAWQGTLFDHIQLVPLQLSVNFRSTRPIVDWVNRTFPVVMPRTDDPVLGAVCYSEASTKPAVSSDGNVTIRILPERDDEEEARRVVDLIGGCDVDEKIAILVRSRSHASAILAQLDRLKATQSRYRYQAINFTPLAGTSLIQDLVSLTLALLQPADRLAWLAILRSPAIGISLADLDTLVSGDPDSIIMDAIQAAAGELANAETSLTGDGLQRLRRAGPVLARAVEQRGRRPARSLVESTWVRLGGPACINNDSELLDAATFFDLLETLENENLPIDRDTLALRLDDLSAEPDARADGKLQVLTVYAAKGLQFDRVILPGLNRPPSGDGAKLLRWFELAGENRIVMSPMRNNMEKEQLKKSGDLIRFISGIEKQRQRLEDGRLLYVAATRAIHRLHMFAAIKPTANGDIKANGNSLLGGLWPAIQAEQTPLIEAAAGHLQEAGNAGNEEHESRETGFPQTYRRLAADWQLPEPPRAIDSSVASFTESQNYIEFSWAGEDARHSGNLVHRILQMIAEQGLDQWEAGAGVSTYRNWCFQQLAREGIKKDKAVSIFATVSQAIRNCLASEQGRWILGNHEAARCEFAITALLDKKAGPKRLVLDRTFVDNGIRWIIDYKTSSHAGGDLDNFLENESRRYSKQLLEYKTALELTESRPVKTALYFPLLDRLVEVP
jgi:ATP-dependent exoDNAse (exonuclease V) beta subunit